MNPVIIAHGGIEYGGSNDNSNKKLIALKNAVIRGYSSLRVGNSSVDAVETTIRILEDNEEFNAGYHGSVINADGEIELDAGIMNGTDFTVGSVGAVKNIRYPITLARHVMEYSDHSLLVGGGATKFASRLAECPSDLMAGVSTSLAVSSNAFPSNPSYPESCTVGVVAIDAAGKCTAGSSSGGGYKKWPGRVGSSATVGGGFYADSKVGGSVATGHGESIMKFCLCFDVLDKMSIRNSEGGLTMIAVKNVVEHVTKKTKKSVGVAALDREGDFGVAFSAPRMPWAYCRRGELRFGAESGENHKEYL